MIERYQDKDVEKIWNEKNKLKTWLDVEIRVAEGWATLGVIPKKDLEKIKANAKIDMELMKQIELVTKHDVVAFTRMLSESLGEEKKWIHLGLTSTDVVDTSQNILIRESNILLEHELDNLLSALKKRAIAEKQTLISGRTHGIYGEPTSLGLKFLLWYDELRRQKERLELARRQIEVSKISGSMGNYANIEPEIEEYVAKAFGLAVDNLSTQVTQRDRHAFLISVFANIASTFEKIATEIRLFQRSEVQEMSEGFDLGQKGSSSMPHKKNPISSENIVGLARYIKTFTNIAFENNVLWHERDISHSSNERIMFPDIFNALVYSTKRLTNVISSLFINNDKINVHLEEQHGVYYSQKVLTDILRQGKHSREVIYDFIQKCTLQALEENADFKRVLIKNNIEQYVDLNTLDKMFDKNYFTKNVDKIYRRVL